jgi:hypothetical protein
VEPDASPRRAYKGTARPSLARRVTSSTLCTASAPPWPPTTKLPPPAAIPLGWELEWVEDDD